MAVAGGINRNAERKAKWHGGENGEIIMSVKKIMAAISVAKMAERRAAGNESAAASMDKGENNRRKRRECQRYR
jgi:hypothetical protein